MSAGSFDESSNLVDIPSSPTNEEKKFHSVVPETSSEQTTKDESDFLKSKTKKSKGIKGFLKRAKSPQPSPLKSPSKSPLRSAFKSLPKHHSKSHQKSPSKSPSKENLTEEFKNLEQKISEKKSEEWLAFKEMQERIKLTVLHTQTSLNKYTTQPEESDENPCSDNQAAATSWTGFDEEDSLEPEEPDLTGVNPSINISLAGYENEQCAGNYLDATRGLAHLDTTPVPSPPFTPAPPSNSPLPSMENLMEENMDLTLKEAPQQEEVDLLGLMSSDTAYVSPSSARMNQDLLGLDSFMTPTSIESQISDPSTKTLEGYTYSLSSAMSQSEKPSQSPQIAINPITSKPEHSLLFDTDILGDTPPLDSVVSNPAADFLALDDGFGSEGPADRSLSPNDHVVPDPAMQMFSQTIVDDFADLDPMKPDFSATASSTVASFNPFTGTESSSLPIAIERKEDNITSGFSAFGSSPQTSSTIDGGIAISSLYSSSPQPSAPIDMGMNYSSSPNPPIEQDIMSKIKRMSSGSSTPIRRQAPKKPDTDPFSFVKSAMSPKKADDKDKPLVDTKEEEKQKENEGHEKEEVEKQMLGAGNVDIFDQTDTNTSNNPFLTGNFEVKKGVDDFMYSNEAFNGSTAFGDPASADVFTDGTKPSDTSFPVDVERDGKGMDAWGDTDQFKGVDLDSAWDSAFTSETKPAAGDAWGSKAAADNAFGDVAVDSGSGHNPFQDDFSTLENIPVEAEAGSSANPFLSGDITDVTVPPVATTGASNPFLDFTTDRVSDTSASNDLDDFFKGTAKAPMADAVVDEMDDFDPFKVVSKTPEPCPQVDDDFRFGGEMTTTIAAVPRPYKEETDGFKLEIKPVSDSKTDSSSEPVPTLKPPPPRSPQPPRENPFDRDSPPEETFAQFEAMDNEKPKEPPKSLSTDSTTSEEEEILEPLEIFLPVIEKEGFKLMLRYPTKKKLTGNRYWKNVFVKVCKQNDGPVIKVYNDANDALTMQELPLQPCYSLSEMSLQQYDQYGKIHTAKLQYIFYKERVGIRSERITPSFVRKPKATMILDHSPQVSELLKFGSLDKDEMLLFVQEVDDALMNLEAHREKTLTYTKDEVTAELHDEYKAELDKHGKVLTQKARVRIFVLAFVTGMPTVEVGLNDKRRRGKEVVGRCDIIPIKTEEWIRLEDVQFHCCVDKAEFEKTNNIKFHPLDACQFELLRYRVRPRINKELPLQLTIQQIFKDRKVEIRCDLLVTGYHSFSKKHGQFPCEDIEVRFPIPESWIYLFRYERRFGYGSIHSASRKPGKIKGLERLTMMAQGAQSAALMEADVGTAKYEHVYRSVVWRIPRLPVRNQGAYTSHLMKLKLEMGPHDEVPESFEKFAFVEFTMPCSTVSQSQIRSVSVTNPNPPEKWVRYVAHYNYKIEIEHLDEYPENVKNALYEEEVKPVPKKEGKGEDDDDDDEEDNDVDENRKQEGLALSDSDDSSD